MATIEIENAALIVEQALAELPDDTANEERRKYLLNLQRILAFPPIKSDLDPVQLIREDRDR